MSWWSNAWQRMRFFGATPGPTDDFWYEFPSRSSQAGVRVTPDLALKASALYAVVKVLAETMATMPLQMFRDLGPRGREPVPEHPLDEVIRFQPNTWQTAIEFWEMMIFHAVLRGTGYAEIVPGRRGAVDQLWPIHPDRVRVEQLADHSLRFRVTQPRSGATKILLQEEMFRIPGMSSDGVTGLKVIDLASDVIGLGLAADTFAARVFSNRLNIGGFLIHPGKLGTDAQKRLVQALMEKAAGAENAHRPVILQEGFKFERGADTSKDSQLLEARKWQVAEIARFFRVPLHMLDIDDQTNRSTVEAQAIDFVKYTLRPWGRRIEQAIRRDLIVNRKTFAAKYNMMGLLRGDSAARSAYFSAALGASGRGAFMTPNEVRAIEGLNPSAEPGADRLGGVVEAGVPGQLAIADSSGRTAAEKLVAIEVAAVRKAAMRFAGDAAAFKEWLDAFYGGHASSVMRLMQVDNEVARSYCRRARDELLGAHYLNGTLDDWLDDPAAAAELALVQRGGNGAVA